MTDAEARGKPATYFTSKSRVLSAPDLGAGAAIAIAILTSFAAYIMAYSLAARRGPTYGALVALGGLAVFVAEGIAFRYLWGRGYGFVSARRLALAYSASNVAWIVALVPAAVLGRPALALYSVFPFWAVRAYLVGAVFSSRSPRALSAVLSTALAPAYNVALDFQRAGPAVALPVAFGVPLVAVAGASLALLERGRMNGLWMLGAFLEAWSSSRADLLESAISELGDSGFARGYIIGSSRFVLVVPYVHPGPFRPVGSYDVPGRMSGELLRAGVGCSAILHGAVDHDRNLASRSLARRYALHVARAAVDGFGRSPLSPPVTLAGSRVRLTGIWIGGSALLLIAEPVHGLEDYGDGVVERLEELGRRHGVRVIVADAHNSVGPDPGEAEVAELEGLAEEILRRGPPAGRVVRCGCSMRPGPVWPDIGSAGISAIALEDDSGRRYAIVSVDSNNASPGFREAVEGALRRQGFDSALLCTTDTHETTGIYPTSRGYSLLGEAGDGALGMIVEAGRAALASLGPCDGAGIKEVSVRSMFMGAGFLHASREMASRSLRIAKRALILALALAAVGYVAVALL
ncbi:MAG: DUF2070 family protein [Nitrososphaeria archaeon]